MLLPEPATVVGGTDFCHNRIVKVICCALPLLCSNGIRFQELTTRVNSPVLLCSVEWWMNISASVLSDEGLLPIRVSLKSCNKMCTLTFYHSGGAFLRKFRSGYNLQRFGFTLRTFIPLCNLSLLVSSAVKGKMVSHSTIKRALALSNVQQMLHNYSHDISLSIQARQSLTWLVTGTWRSSWGSVSRANWLFWETCCCCKWNSQEEIVINCHGCSAFNQGAVSTMDCFSNSRERYSILFLI